MENGVKINSSGRFSLLFIVFLFNNQKIVGQKFVRKKQSIYLCTTFHKRLMGCNQKTTK